MEQTAEELNNGLIKIKSKLLQQTLGNKIQFETSGGEEFYEIKKILIGNFNRFYIIWTIACVILTHIHAV
jgi:hypothetical protein